MAASSAYWHDRTADGFRVHCDRRGVILDEIECEAGALAYIAEFEAVAPGLPSEVEPHLSGGVRRPVFDDAHDRVFGPQPLRGLPRRLPDGADKKVSLGEGDFAPLDAADELLVLDIDERGTAVPVGQAPFLAALERKIDDREHLRVERLEQVLPFNRGRQEGIGGLAGNLLLDAVALQGDHIDAGLFEWLDSYALQGRAEGWIERNAAHGLFDFDRLVIEFDLDDAPARHELFGTAPACSSDQRQSATADNADWHGGQPDNLDELEHGINVGPDDEVSDGLVGALCLDGQLNPEAAVANRANLHGDIERVAVHDAIGSLDHLSKRNQRRSEIGHIDLMVRECGAVEFEPKRRSGRRVGSAYQGARCHRSLPAARLPEWCCRILPETPQPATSLNGEAAWVSAATLSHILVLRDLANGTEYLDQTPVAYSFKDAVRDLADAQIPMGFELARVECVDRAAGRITDVTERALNEVARTLEANNELSGSFSRCLLSACEAYGVVLPELDDEGSVDAGIIRGAHRRGASVADYVGEAA